MEKKLRIGLIGIGGMGSHHLFTSHAENPRVQIVALCDLIEERCTNAIKRLGELSNPDKSSICQQ